jgi:hypothetical protein
MHKFLRFVFVLAFAGGGVPAATAAAGDLTLTLGNGRATLIAQDVPLRQILAEWARLGQTSIVNADKLNGPALTLQLVDRPEREVLEVLLRSASGYIAAERAVNIVNASVFERVMILPTSRGPVGVAAAAPPPQFGRPNMSQQQLQQQQMQQMQMQQQPPVEDEDEPMDPNVPTNQPMANQPGPPFPNAPAQGQPGQQPPVVTSPRPGMLPAPPGGQPQTPYGNPPNIRPPGSGPGDPNDEP